MYHFDQMPNCEVIFASQVARYRHVPADLFPTSKRPQKKVQTASCCPDLRKWQRLSPPASEDDGRCISMVCVRFEAALFRFNRSSQARPCYSRSVCKVSPVKWLQSSNPVNSGVRLLGLEAGVSLRLCSGSEHSNVLSEWNSEEPNSSNSITYCKNLFRMKCDCPAGPGGVFMRPAHCHRERSGRSLHT